MNMPVHTVNIYQLQQSYCFPFFAVPEIQQSSPPLSLPPTPPPVEGHIHIHVPGSPENNEGKDLNSEEKASTV